jgi:hypothetical protein
MHDVSHELSAWTEDDAKHQTVCLIVHDFKSCSVHVCLTFLGVGLAGWVLLIGFFSAARVSGLGSWMLQF